MGPTALILHAGPPLDPSAVWAAWATEPAITIPLLLAGAVYTRGLRSAWRRAGAGRGIRPGQVALAAGGWLALWAALASPLDPLSGALFSAHMVQHLLLVLVAAPMLAAGAPLVAAIWALPAAARRPVVRRWRALPLLPSALAVLATPGPALLLHAAALWAWHVPPWYDAALLDDRLHALEHLSMLSTALLFWWSILGPGAARGGRQGLAIVYLVVAALQGAALGALLSFSKSPWYSAHLGSAPAWGLTPLEDQQLAGVLMWAPAGLVYLIPLAALMVGWFRAAERMA